MKTIRISIIATIYFIFLYSYAYSMEKEWPSANKYEYPKYEVEMIEHVIYYYNSFFGKIDDNKKVELYISHNFNLEPYKKKYLSAFVLMYMNDFVHKDFTIDIKHNSKIVDFINDNENSEDYSIQGIKNKFIVWSLIQFQIDKPCDESAIAMKERRRKLLNNIKMNDPSYASLTDFLSIVHEGESNYDKYIENYPATQFAAILRMYKLFGLRHSKSYELTLQTAYELLKNNENFYTGHSDFYTDVYIEVVFEILKDFDKKDEIVKMLDLLNVLSNETSQAKKRFMRFVNGITDENEAFPELLDKK